MNESRMKIYEQLELSMIDLEKGNTRLKEEAHVDKERVRGLTATVATLELRCEELQRCLDDVVLRRVGSVEDRTAEERHPPGVVCQVSKLVMGKHVCKTEICTPRQFMWLRCAVKAKHGVKVDGMVNSVVSVSIHCKYHVSKRIGQCAMFKRTV